MTHEKHSIAAIDRLRLFLRPPGRGIPTLSSAGFTLPIVKALYATEEQKEVQSAWEDSLQRIRRVDAVVMGVPTDTGAGIVRGASLGPAGVRAAFLAHSRYPKSTLDIGDVVSVPHLLHDDMLSPHQLAATRAALYGTGAEALPVSPLSLAEAALSAVHELNGNLKLVLLGGDHSVSWPAVRYCHRRFGDAFAILHIGAEPALAEHRFGVRHSHATWAHHALGLVKAHHFVQVGLSRTRKPKEPPQPLVQCYADEVRGREAEIVAKIVEHFHSREARNVFVSIDVDVIEGESGLSSAFVESLVTAIGRDLTLVGADVVEVAPPLSALSALADEPTCVLGARVLHTVLDAMRL